MARDPVCGMEVDPEKSNWVAEYDGKDYFFCSERCQKAFMKDPTKYTEIRPMGHGLQGMEGIQVAAAASARAADGSDTSTSPS